MNAFNKRTAVRIAIVSVLLAAVASPVAWFVAHQNAEQGTVSLAMEDSRRLLRHFDAIALSGPNAAQRARKAADALAGGLFDIAEIYNRNGQKLALAMTAEGIEVESRLPPHPRPAYTAAAFESLRLPDGRWILRVFVPLQVVSGSAPAGITGYFEGVRIVSDWQRRQMLNAALSAALIAGLASLLCGAAIYPVVVRLSADNERKAREVLDSHIAMMEALGRAIAKRDSETGAHNFRVAWIATRIGERLGLGARSMQSLIVGSFLHDIGKISIPDAILRKPGGLDREESEIMHTHVAQGEDIVAGVGWLEEAKDIVAAHHEKWDGSGYPRRLAGATIPLAARIFAVADVFDALCSRRPYKEPMDFEKAMAILEADTGSHFDPGVMAAFRPIAREVFDRLARCDEGDARGLLEERVHLHFGM
ncbi:MAG TPA: HD-GYP domain-containing protein [Noviherbaspirillum sp.]|nr:HD-GYP domain-containing protein [Noviherbaspirillum sp.]